MAEQSNNAPRPTPFRFKSRRSDRKDGASSSSSHRRHHHSERPRQYDSKRRRRDDRSRSPDRDPRGENDNAPARDPFACDEMDPETAFRESLFDAMADDEGAAFWEGVYGQPIHTYASARDQVNGQGELERMTDEEYAAYVRQKMWEKTHAGLVEAKERRQREREERERQREESRRRERAARREREEKIRVVFEMDDSLKRGQERQIWTERWSDYEEACKKWDEEKSISRIPWPLEKLAKEQRTNENYRLLFKRGLGRKVAGEKAYVATLKDHRVRWHPDKIQQRLGGQVDEDLMKDVTRMFQIVDDLLTEAQDALDQEGKLTRR